MKKESAFPTPRLHQQSELGLTKREYFIAAALTGLSKQGYDSRDIAVRAVEVADFVMEILKLNEKS